MSSCSFYRLFTVIMPHANYVLAIALFLADRCESGLNTLRLLQLL